MAPLQSGTGTAPRHSLQWALLAVELRARLMMMLSAHGAITGVESVVRVLCEAVLICLARWANPTTSRASTPRTTAMTRKTSLASTSGSLSVVSPVEPRPSPVLSSGAGVIGASGPDTYALPPIVISKGLSANEVSIRPVFAGNGETVGKERQSIR